MITCSVQFWTGSDHSDLDEPFLTLAASPTGEPQGSVLGVIKKHTEWQASNCDD